MTIVVHDLSPTSWLITDANSEVLDANDLAQYFEPAYLAQHNLITQTASGRGDVFFFKFNQHTQVLRHYLRGGLIAKITSDRFLFAGIAHTRAYKEMSILLKLGAQGLNVPQPLAARVIKHNWQYTADIMTREIANSQELHSLLQEGHLSSQLWQLIGQQIRQLHDLQACHYDINVKNILLQKQRDGSDEVYLLDFDACEIRKGDGWKQTNLARLCRSLRKHSAQFKDSNTTNYYYDDLADWQAFMHGYNSTSD